jgi:hypothetical protein
VTPVGCYRCRRRQDDPVRGASPWKRGVVRDEQVLVCPGCQESGDWMLDLDRCGECAGTALVRALGETRCRSCGHVGPGLAAEREGVTEETTPVGGSLADEVAAALSRVLDSPPGGRDEERR